MKDKLKIAIIYSDAQPQFFASHDQYLTEAEVFDRAKIISQYLQKQNIDSVVIPGNSSLTENLKKYQPHFALNLVDSIYGDETLSAATPATLELLKIPYTGTGMAGLNVNTNKFLTKNLLCQYGITTPRYQLITNPHQEIDISLEYPLIAKLNEIHGSVEISQKSVCSDEKSLRHQIDHLYSTYKQPILVEEYIAGREITVIVLEGLNTKLYAAEKIIPKDGEYNISSYNLVWNDFSNLNYQKYELPQKVKDNLKLAFEVLKMDDWGKFDLRLDQSGRHYIIDCNANSCFGPKEVSSLGKILGMYDISFDEVLLRIVKNTLNGHAKDFFPNDLNISL